MSHFRPYHDIIVREIPDDFNHAIGAEGKKLDVELARKQHRAYVNALKKTGAKVYYLPRRNNQPDSVFVEDIAVIIDDKVLLTRPEPVSRREEVSEDLFDIFQERFGLKVETVEDKDREATLDGGDVIFTGKEIIAGHSRRTNDKGIQVLRETFPRYNVVAVEVHGPLHLTTMMGLYAEDTLSFSTETDGGRAMFDQIREKSKIKYKKLEVPDDVAANCIAINGILLCKSEKENPKSYPLMKDAKERPVVGLDASEIEKAVGSLTCMSLRFNTYKIDFCPGCFCS